MSSAFVDLQSLLLGFVAGILVYHFRMGIAETVLKLVEWLKGKKVVLR